jgi:hypothetical protein
VKQLTDERTQQMALLELRPMSTGASKVWSALIDQ